MKIPILLTDFKPCACGQKMFFAERHDPEKPDEEVKTIPLSASPAVYRVTERYKEGSREILVVDRDRECFVSHHVTCTKRERFKRP